MDAVQYASRLITFDSVSSKSNVEVSDYIEQVLREQAFEVERLEYDDRQAVRKACLVAKRGSGQGGLAYFGHSDVVPVDHWSFSSGPFTPLEQDGRLYGRGSCDMKGSVACMLAAAEQTRDTPLAGPVYFVCTADEEIGYGGADTVAERSELFREMVAGDTRAIIGEPTGLDVVYAHKGTYGFCATARGRAAHSSTHHGRNANLAMIPFLSEMKRIHDETESDPAWQNDEFNPPSITWNIGINDHTHAINITAPQSVCTVYFRPMPGQPAEQLLERARQAAERQGLEFQVTHSNPPVHTPPDSDIVQSALRIADQHAARTVPYGTDGSRFRDLRQMIILGPGDIAQAHTADEWIAVDQLQRGTQLYANLMREWSGHGS